MLFNKLVYILSAFALISCDKGKPADDPSEPDMSKELTIDVSKSYQTIDGFSASDCWTGNYVGKYWSSDAKEGIAKLLFSQKPNEGIGLSMWRFNLGGGTAEQGSGSGIDDVSRRAECFLLSDGTYDWNRQSGQQFFLQKAKEYGCTEFVMFSNTPPVHYTKNGKGSSASGAYSNLKDDCYDKFALYMATVAHYFKQNKGIDFKWISPVNEPQYNWESGQEGSGWQNSQIKTLTVALDKALTDKGLSTNILLSESGDWEYLYKNKSDQNRSDQINDFFSPTSSNYVGDLAHVPALIGGHSYWTDGSFSSLSSTRSAVAAAAAAKGLKVYQTEWSMLGDHFGDDYPGHDKADYIDIALYMSKVIHYDLSVANVSSWSYWTSMDVERWGHKNRFFLVRLIPAGGDYGDITQSGTFQATKTLWALGNYSSFIRPGYKRVDLNIYNQSNLFFGSAYVSPSQDKLVVVYTNLTQKSISVKPNIKGMSGSISSIKSYSTSLSQDLVASTIENENYSVAPRSILTVVYEF